MSELSERTWQWSVGTEQTHLFNERVIVPLPIPLINAIIRGILEGFAKPRQFRIRQAANGEKKKRTSGVKLVSSVIELSVYPF